MNALLHAILGISVAGVPVVFEGVDEAAVLQRVADRSATPIDQLDATPVSALLGTPPPLQVAGGGTLRHCAGTTTRAADVRTLQLRAEAAWRSEDLQTALDQLDLGITRLGCLGDRVEPKVAARLFLLRGGLLAQAGDPEGGKAELRTALALHPDAQWDGTLPDAGAPLLQAVAAEPQDASLAAVPTVSTPPWVDGRAVTTTTVPLRPGLHLVQRAGPGGLQSAWLSLESPATLVMPDAYRRPVLSQLADDSHQPAVLALLQATVGTDPTYVATADALWLITWDAGTPQVETLQAPTVTPPAEAEAKKKKRRR